MTGDTARLTRLTGRSACIRWRWRSISRAPASPSTAAASSSTSHAVVTQQLLRHGRCASSVGPRCGPAGVSTAYHGTGAAVGGVGVVGAG